jgi:HK97 family phage major capsid protein
MSDLEIKGAIDKLGRTFDEFKQANDQAIDELKKKGAVDPLLLGKVDKLSEAVGDLDSVKSRLVEAEKALARNRASFEQTSESGKLDQKALDFVKSCYSNRGRVYDGDYTAKQLDEYKAAYREYLEKGEHVLSPESQKALSVGSDPDGGYVIDPDNGGRIVKKIFETSAIRGIANVQTIGTNSLSGLFDLNEASSGWVGEQGARTETNTPQLGRWDIPVHEMYAFPFATQKVLDDAQMDLEGWLSDKVADKFSRIENIGFVIGDGVDKPRGILTYAAGTTIPNTIEQISTGVNGGFAADPNGGDKLLDMVYALKQGYRSNARWAMGRLALAAVRKLQDSNGAYIWSPGLGGQPSTLLDFPISELEDMPVIATGSLSIAFGDFREAYQIVDRMGIRIIRDNLTNKPHVGLYAVKRVGGGVVNFEAIKLLKFSA